MALYVSRQTRRRRLVVAVVITAVVTFVLGLAIGRQFSSSVTDRVAAVRERGVELATGMERLDIEYEQILSGEDDLEHGVLTPLAELRSNLQSTLERAVWLSSNERGELLDALATVESSAQNHE